MPEPEKSSERMNKAQRLAIAGTVAPFVRESAEVASVRRVARVDANGIVVGYTTLAEVQKSLLRRHEIEIATQPGVRPKQTICVGCGVPTRLARVGSRRRYCDSCQRPKCSDCGKQLDAAVGRRRCMDCHLARKSRSCKRGHEFTEANTRTDKRGRRACKRCEYLKTRARHDRAKEERRARGFKKPKPRPPASHCGRGHEMSGHNLYVTPSGQRMCRQCLQIRTRAYRDRKRRAVERSHTNPQSNAD